VTDAGRGSGADHSVAIVMRTRDRPLFLERALRSVLEQTSTDWELLVVNDGGDRETVDALLRRWPAPGTARVRAVHHPAPVGLLSPPNAPVRETSAAFVVVHDDDDTWDPSFLELTTRRLRESGAMGVIATTDKVVETVEDGRIVELERTRLYPGAAFVNLFALCFENYATPIAFVYRRDAYDAIGGYDESLGTVADWDFALRLVSRFDVELLRTPRALAFYHHRVDAAGADLNAVYTDRHRDAENRIANRYLREDLDAGRPGLGLIMNALRREYETNEAMFARHKEASNEQTRYLADCIRKVDERVMELQHALTPAERAKADARFLRSLPRKVGRRVAGRRPKA
jgi:O-antigen biosynthesis protein